MTQIRPDKVKEISLSAAQSVARDVILDVDLTAGFDSESKPAYYISFKFKRDRDPALAALMRTRISQKIRDTLIAKGDAHYPIVRFLAQDEWDHRQRD